MISRKAIIDICVLPLSAIDASIADTVGYLVGPAALGGAASALSIHGWDDKGVGKGGGML